MSMNKESKIDRSVDEEGEEHSKKRIRRNENENEKELIDELKWNVPSDEMNEKRWKENSSYYNGSKQMDEYNASLLPSSDFYEKSFMHRDVVTHVIVTKTHFLITGSHDGHLKFWKILTADYLKKQQTMVQIAQTSKSSDDQHQHQHNSGGLIEFVKHFRAHLGNRSFLSLFPLNKNKENFFEVQYQIFV